MSTLDETELCERTRTPAVYEKCGEPTIDRSLQRTAAAFSRTGIGAVGVCAVVIASLVAGQHVRVGYALLVLATMALAVAVILIASAVLLRQLDRRIGAAVAQVERSLKDSVELIYRAGQVRRLPRQGRGR